MSGKAERSGKDAEPEIWGASRFVSQCGILHGGKKLKTCAWNNIIYIQRERERELCIYIFFKKKKWYLWFNQVFILFMYLYMHRSVKPATYLQLWVAMTVKQLQTSLAMAAAEVTLDEARLLLSNFGSNQGPVMWCKCCHLMVLMCSFGSWEDAIPETWLAVGQAWQILWCGKPSKRPAPSPTIWGSFCIISYLGNIQHELLLGIVWGIEFTTLNPIKSH